MTVSESGPGVDGEVDADADADTDTEGDGPDLDRRWYVSVSGPTYALLKRCADGCGVTLASVLRGACSDLLDPDDAGRIEPRRTRRW